MTVPPERLPRASATQGDDVVAALRELSAAAARTAEEMAPQIATALAMMRGTVRAGGTLFFCGNGGSAADAQHLATEYVVRYTRTRRAYPAVALTTDTSLLTAAGNDLGFDEIFARQVEALTRPGDLLIIHSTSGNSPNVIRAAEAARARGVPVLAFTAGAGGRLVAVANHSVVVPVTRTDRAQELHLCIGHLLCELLEREL
ncbi:MAG TPA: SIS domain-containing protein [Gemmatimonadaceae bacterium]|nr:SIS domain-containing protein [Gemmatimonadaceae bacterium]